MAKVIIGGQALSLVLALIVTPVFYVLLDQWVNFTRRIGIHFAVRPRARAEEASGEKAEVREAAGSVR